MLNGYGYEIKMLKRLIRRGEKAESCHMVSVWAPRNTAVIVHRRWICVPRSGMLAWEEMSGRQ